MLAVICNDCYKILSADFGPPIVEGLGSHLPNSLRLIRDQKPIDLCFLCFEKAQEKTRKEKQN